MVRKHLKKRILALCIVMTLILSLFVYQPAIAVEQESNSFDAEVFMNNLGISVVDDKDAFITRGDFAVLLLQSLEIDELSGEAYFTDVSGKQGEYVNTAAQMGIVSKNAERLYYPERIISAAEAATMILRLLGYTEIMDDKTYPSAYMSWASKLRILDRVYGREQLTGSDATHIIYNMLNSKYVTAIISKDPKKTKYTTSDVTYMEAVLKVYKKSGIVESICAMALNDSTAVSNTEIKISGNTYMNPCYSEAKNYLYMGKRVNYYVKEDEEGTKVIYMYSNQKTLSVSASKVSDVKGFDMADAANYKRNPVLKYYNDSKKNVEVKIDSRADIFVNGVASVSVSNEDFTPETGMIYFIDTDNNGVYDVIFIEKYTYYYVSEFDPSNGVIIDYYEKESIKLQEVKEEYIEFVSNNKVADSNIVAKGVVLEVMCSYDADGKIDYGKLIRIGLSNGKITGKIEALGEDVVCINGQEYRYISSLAAKIREEFPREGTWFLGRDNLIVACDNFSGKEALNYGWLVDVQGYGGISKKVNFKVFTTRGEMLVFDAADNIAYTGLYNGEFVYGKRLKTDQIMRVITPKELIKYDLDADGKLCLIQRAVDKSSDPEYIGFDEDYFTLDYKTGTCFSSTGWIESGHVIDSANTICLYVNTNSTDERDFVASDYDARGSSINGYPLKIYDSNNRLQGGVVVIENMPRRDVITGSKYFSIGRAWLITDKKYVLQSDGTYKIRLDVARGQTVRSFYATDDELAPLNDLYYNVPTDVTKFSDLEPGDIISADTNKVDLLEGYMVLHDFDSSFEKSYSEGYQLNSGLNWLADFKRILGRATHFQTGSVLKVDSSGADRFAVGRHTTNYMIYNAATKTVERPTGPENVTEGDYVWAYVYRTNVLMLVKYVNE